MRFGPAYGWRSSTALLEMAHTPTETEPEKVAQRALAEEFWLQCSQWPDSSCRLLSSQPNLTRTAGVVGVEVEEMVAVAGKRKNKKTPN